MTKPESKRGPRLRAAIALIASLSSAPARTEAPNPMPEQVRAAYVLNFTRYTTWPASAISEGSAPLVVCALGPGASDVARQLQSRAAGNHPLELRALQHPDQVSGCHALYLGPTERAQQSSLLARLRNQAILTIGESPSFLADGGMINLVLVDGNLHFEVNLAATAGAGMQLNPRMLALADKVIGGGAK